MTEQTTAERHRHVLLAAYLACVVAAWVVARVFDEDGSLAGLYLLLVALPVSLVVPYVLPEQVAFLAFEVMAVGAVAQGFVVWRRSGRSA